MDLPVVHVVRVSFDNNAWIMHLMTFFSRGHGNEKMFSFFFFFFFVSFPSLCSGVRLWVTRARVVHKTLVYGIIRAIFVFLAFCLVLVMCEHNASTYYTCMHTGVGYRRSENGILPLSLK